MTSINRNNTKKKDIVGNIFTNIGISSFYATKIVNDFINILIFNLLSNKFLKIKNFGTFNLLKKNIRMGRNPKNKKNYEILERNIVSFKPSEKLKIKVNINAKK